MQVVRLAGEMGPVKLGTAFIDSARLKANASHQDSDELRVGEADRSRAQGTDRRAAGAKATDEAEINEPELDLPAEIERREARPAAIREARQRLAQRQRGANLERGRSDGEDRRPRGADGKPNRGRHEREFGVPEDPAQENFTDPNSRIMKRAGARFDPAYNSQRRRVRLRTSSWRPNWTTPRRMRTGCYR